MIIPLLIGGAIAGGAAGAYLGNKFFGKAGTNQYDPGSYTGRGQGGSFNFGAATGGKFNQTVNYEADPDAYSPDKFMWGQRRGAAEEDIDRARTLGLGAQDRAAVQMDMGRQNEALNEMRGAMYGTAPSVAQLQMQRGLQKQQMAQASAAASVRGPAAMGLGQINAAQSMQAAQSQENEADAMLSAKEMSQAREAYYGASNQSAYQQAGLGLKQRELNDAQQRFFEQQGFDVGNLQMGGSIQNQGFRANAYNRQQDARAQIAQANANNEFRQKQAIFGAMMGGASLGSSIAGGGGGAGGAGASGMASGGGSGTQYSPDDSRNQNYQMGKDPRWG